MADLKISHSELSKAIQLSKEIEKELTNSYDTVAQLRSYLGSVAWSGQTKDAFLTYLDIIFKYHHDLNQIMTKHREAVESLERSVNEYNSSSEVGTIKGL